ncbi:MAG: DUF2480 family protein [Bergeyella sp.]|nr:DUF2480 family protein [Bergeyella sp.]
MEGEFEIRNRVTESGLISFDLESLLPKGKRIGIDIKDFLFEAVILKEKDFRAKVALLDREYYRNAYIHLYNSAEAIVPLWVYFILTAHLTEVAKKIAYGSEKELEILLMHEAIESYNFEELRGKRVVVKGCSKREIPENAYVALVEKLKPIVKSLMFGEACSNVPIFKN